MPNAKDIPPGLLLTEHLSLDRCPHCSTAKPTLELRYAFVATPLAASFASDSPYTWHVYSCKSCAGAVCAAKFQNRPQVRTPGFRGVHAPAIDNTVVWLVPGVQSFDAAILPGVATFLRQAAETIASPSASIMMSNSAVDAMLKGIGYGEGPLYSRIDRAATENRITLDMAAWAHEVRLDANNQRHADQAAAEPVAADAERCLDFARTLADILYVLPERVKRGRGQELPKA